MGTIGNRIDNPMLIIDKKSVYVKRWKRHCSVAFLLSMQFKELASLINDGIFEYTKEDKTNKPKFTQIVRSYKDDTGLYKLGNND